MKKIFDKIKAANISIHEYKEGKKLCGYELNTYTSGGLNQIVFVDFRDTDKNPKDKNDFKELFLERVNSIDTDEEVEMNRQNKDYCRDFTLRESLDDIEAWKKDLVKLAESL
jgi:hypothetical protein